VKTRPPNALARALRHFFSEHLAHVRGLSHHTVRSYRDSLVLLLRFVAAKSRRPAVALDLDDFGAREVLEFLDHLEKERRSSAASRNVRLAAIHSFFRYLAVQHPDRLEQSQRVLAVPFKRARRRAVQYLEYEEIQAVLAAIDRGKPDGRRDYTLLATMFNTGARVQEILDVRPCDLQLVRPFHVRLRGKGRKERVCPLWPETVELLHELLIEGSTDDMAQESLFRNHRRQPLTRFGVRYILGKYCRRAEVTMPSLRSKRLHPHSMRHSTAMHLLQAGVDLATISHWLGHASLVPTSCYATADLEMKRKALAKAKPIVSNPALARWRKNGSILDWLSNL
jgi:integrase/recombinase XerD